MAVIKRSKHVKIRLGRSIVTHLRSPLFGFLNTQIYLLENILLLHKLAHILLQKNIPLWKVFMEFIKTKVTLRRAFKIR